MSKMGDLWRTPPQVIEYVQGRFGTIEIDLCSSYENRVCDFNITEENNFLDDCWLATEMIDKGQLAWCNPPYSNPKPFVEQCIKWARHGYGVVMLLNNDPSTQWYNLILRHATVVMPISGGRIPFLNHEGVAFRGNNKPQVMAYFAPFLPPVQVVDHVSINDIYEGLNR